MSQNLIPHLWLLPQTALAQYTLDLADSSLAQPWNLQSALPQSNGRCLHGLLQDRMGAPQNWQRPTWLCFPTPLFMTSFARVDLRWYPGGLSWRNLTWVCEGPSRYFYTSRWKGRESPVLTFLVYCGCHFTCDSDQSLIGGNLRGYLESAHPAGSHQLFL